MRNNNSLPRKKRHKKIMNMAKGFFGSRSKHFRSANEAVNHSLENKTISRKLLKRNMRKLWIVRMNSFCRTEFNISYSKFINLLKDREVNLNRKIISDMLVTDRSKTKEYFSKILFS